jgi:IS5 family transposase
MIRRVRNTIAEAAAVEVCGHDYTQAGKPSCAWDDPDARNELVSRLVNDARAVLAALDGVALDEEGEQLVALLALVAGQDVEADPDRGEGAWRIARGVASERVISTVDPQSRHMHKSRSSYRDGYKAHIAVEPDTGLITGCALTPANWGDGPTGVELLTGEEPNLEVLADSAYGSGQVRADLVDAGHTPNIKPWPLARNPKLGADQFRRDDFVVDYTARTVTCPQGLTVAIHPGGNATFGVRCRGCPARHRCSTATGGKTFRVGEHDQLLAAARADWHAHTGRDTYRQHRPMVERTIAWLVANGHRRVRYRGVDRNHIALTVRAAAINLRRLINLGLHHNGTWTIT